MSISCACRDLARITPCAIWPSFFCILLATVARLAGPGGARSVVAESVLVKHQLLILCMANAKMLTKISDSGTGEHLRDMRAQFATFTVRISRDREGSKWKSDRSANRILECAVAAGSEFVVTGDEHGPGRSDALIEESQTVAGQSGMEGG